MYWYGLPPYVHVCHADKQTAQALCDSSLKTFIFMASQLQKVIIAIKKGQIKCHNGNMTQFPLRRGTVQPLIAVDHSNGIKCRASLINTVVTEYLEKKKSANEVLLTNSSCPLCNSLFPCPLGAPAVLLPNPVPQPQALV